MAKKIELKCDDGGVIDLLESLNSHLADAPEHVGKFILDAINRGTKLVTVDSGTAAGAGVTVLLKPTDFLLDVMVAIRAGDFDYFVE